jgi:hypothetical protein
VEPAAEDCQVGCEVDWVDRVGLPAVVDAAEVDVLAGSGSAIAVVS